MYCLKCGKETEESQVFCSSCQEVMQAYPVKPGTAVHIMPREQRPQEKKAPRRKDADQEEQLNRLRLVIRCLAAAVAVLSVLLCATAGMLIHTLGTKPADNPIGRNYTTAASGNQP